MRTFIIILIICLNTIHFTNEVSSQENKILIKLNNKIITSVDIMNEINYLSIVSSDFKKIEKQQKIEIAKNSLIKEKVKLIELLRYSNNIDLEESIFENVQILAFIKDEQFLLSNSKKAVP